MRTATGTFLVKVAPAGSANKGRTVLYAQVLSLDQWGDLDRQVARLAEWVTGHSLSVDEGVVEVGSGMKGKRRKLARLLADATATTVVVEHRGRLTRFGVEHF